MSKVRSDQYVDRAGTASPLFPQGVRVTGVATAGSFSGGWDGTLSITDATASTNTTSGAVVISGGVGIAKSLNVGGNLSVGGTLTYDDVTNIDSVGIVTAGGGLYVGRAGGTGIGLTASTAGHVIAAGIITTGTCIKVGSVSGGSFGPGVGVTITGDGNAVFSGITTVGGLANFSGGASFNGGSALKEKVKITAGKLSDNLNIDLENGMIYHFTTQETTTAVPNIRVSSSVALNSVMDVGDSITVSVITTAAAGGYSAQWTIDGSAVTEAWNGGAAPTAGGASGKDFYTLNIIKTANATFTVLANVSNFA